MVRSLAVGAVFGLAGLGAFAATPEPGYRLVIEGDRVTLVVADAPLVEVVEDLGRKLGFEVVASSIGEQRISDEFEGLPSRDAIRRICRSVGYLEVPDPKTGKIMRVVLTGGKTGSNRLAPRRDPLPDRPAAEPPEEPPPAPAEAQERSTDADDDGDEDRRPDPGS